MCFPYCMVVFNFGISFLVMLFGFDMMYLMGQGLQPVLHVNIKTYSPLDFAICTRSVTLWVTLPSKGGRFPHPINAWDPPPCERQATRSVTLQVTIANSYY